MSEPVCCRRCNKPDVMEEGLCMECLVDDLVEFAENYDPEKDPNRVRVVLFEDLHKVN